MEISKYKHDIKCTQQQVKKNIFNIQGQTLQSNIISLTQQLKDKRLIFCMIVLH